MDNTNDVVQLSQPFSLSTAIVAAAETVTSFPLNRSSQPPTNTIVFWNCASMREHMDNVRILLHQSTPNRPLVLALAETRVSPSTINNLPSIPDYVPLHKPHTSRSGGLAVLVHSSVAVRELDQSYPQPLLATVNQPAASVATEAGNSSDAFWIELRFPGLATPILLATIYLSPPVSSATVERLTDQIELVRNNTSLPVLLVGDFNLAHARWNDSSCTTLSAIVRPSRQAVELADYLLDNQLTVLNDGRFTNINTNNTRSAIDLAISANDDDGLFSYTTNDGYGLTSTNATHLPITVSLNYAAATAPPAQSGTVQAKRLWRMSSSTPAEQWLGFRHSLTLQLLDSFPFDEIEQRLANKQRHNNTTVAQHQVNIERWTTTLVDCIHTAAEGAFGSRSPGSCFNHWFMLPGVRDSYLCMHAMHKQWQQQHTAAAQQRSEAARQQWNAVKADAKHQAWRDFAGELQLDPQAQVRWSVFHRSFHKPYASLSSFPSPVDGSLPATRAQALDNLAAAYVAASVPTCPLPQHIQQQVDEEIAADPTCQLDESDSWQFTADDVKQQCTRQHTTTASGADGVEALFLKRGGEQLYRALALLYSYSWQYSVLPQSWRDANVCSLYKGSGPKHAATSYRPISVTSILVRTMEH